LVSETGEAMSDENLREAEIREMAKLGTKVITQGADSMTSVTGERA
jgi:hypothetical protein